MKTIRFTSDAKRFGSAYGCSEYGDQSGEYVRAGDAADLLKECDDVILPMLRRMPPPKLGEWNWPAMADRLERAMDRLKGEG